MGSWTGCRGMIIIIFPRAFRSLLSSTVIRLMFIARRNSSSRGGDKTHAVAHFPYRGVGGGEGMGQPGELTAGSKWKNTERDLCEV